MISEGKPYLLSQEDFVCSILKPGDFFVDVGANIGNLSLAANARVMDCRIVAIEANHSTYKSLIRNISINKASVESVNTAVGAYDGENVTISDSVFDDWNCVLDSAKFVDDASKTRLLNSRRNPQMIVQRTLDSLASENCWPSRIKLLKIDIEGYELFALIGGVRLVRKTQFILLEFSELHSARYGYDRQEILDFLAEHGFSVYVIDHGADSLDHVLTSSPIKAATEAPSYCDILAALHSPPIE